MAEIQRCPGRGDEMPANAPHGLCPACLLRQGLASEGLTGMSGDRHKPRELARSIRGIGLAPEVGGLASRLNHALA